MSSITIHELDSDLDNRLSEEARKAKTSKNKLVKLLLARALGLPNNDIYHNDYEEFSGLWSVAEAADFQTYQVDNSRVDPQDWNK